MRSTWLVVVFTLTVWQAVCCAAQEPATDSVEYAEKQLIQAWQKIETLSAKMDVDAQRTKKASHTESLGTGQYYLWKIGGRQLLRITMDTTIKSQYSSNSVTTRHNIVTAVSDGAYTTSMIHTAGDIRFTKQETDASRYIDVVSVLALMRANGEVVRLPDVVADGRECFVFQSVYRDQSSPVSRMIAFLDKEFGVIARKAIVDRSGNVVSTTFIRVIKTNKKMDSASFELEIPDDATLVDLTGTADAH